jgi:chromosome segregation ATPase
MIDGKVRILKDLESVVQIANAMSTHEHLKSRYPNTQQYLKSEYDVPGDSEKEVFENAHALETRLKNIEKRFELEEKLVQVGDDITNIKRDIKWKKKDLEEAMREFKKLEKERNELLPNADARVVDGPWEYVKMGVRELHRSFFVTMFGNSYEYHARSKTISIKKAENEN